MRIHLIIALSALFASHTYGANSIFDGYSGPQFTVTDHLIFSNARSVSDNVQESVFMHEDFVQTQYKNYSAEIRFTNRFESRAEGEAFTLEKKTVSADWNDWQLTLGDKHHEFGKGIALSLYRDDAFGVNNTLEGISLAYEPRGFSLKGIAGRINSLENPVAVNAAPDPLGGDTLWIAGGEIKKRVGKDTEVGTHYFIALNAPQKEKIRRFDQYWNTVGATFAKSEIIPEVDVYAESNVLLPNQLIGEDYIQQPTGYGSYASVTWAPLPTKIRLEAKDYRKYSFPLRRSPTLEEEIVTTDHPEDVSALRLYWENRDIFKKVTFNSSYQFGYDRVVSRRIHHGVFGARFAGPAKTSWEFDFGYRQLPQYSNLAHGSFQVKVPTFKRQKIELGFQKQLLNENLDSFPTTEDRNRFNLTYTFSKNFNATLGYEYVPSNAGAERTNFYSIGAEVRTGSLTAKTFIGRTSGGTLCSSGVCREIPPYNGAMLETLYTF